MQFCWTPQPARYDEHGALRDGSLAGGNSDGRLKGITKCRKYENTKA